MTMPAAQGEAQGIAQTVHGDMDFATEATPTAPQRLFTVFFQPLPHRDGPAQWCYQSSHFPYRDHRQSGPASAPTRLCHTNGQIACRRCSNAHTAPAIPAIERRFSESSGHRSQIVGNRLLCLHRHSDIVLEIYRSLTIGHFVSLSFGYYPPNVNTA